MEKYTMSMDWKNQYFENEYSTQSNLEIHGNSYQATNGIFRKLDKYFHNWYGNTHTHTHKTSNRQSNFKNKNGNGGINLPVFR